MAVDKLVDSVQLDADLTSVADAIRAKTGGAADLQFPADFVSEIQAIPSGGGGTHNLPSGYTEYEYIEATGTQYINTGYIPVATTEVHATIERTAVQNFYASDWGVTPTPKALTAGGYWSWGSATDKSSQAYSPDIPFGPLTVRVNRNGVYDLFGNLAVNFGTVTWTSGQLPIFLFARNNNGNVDRKSKLKIYYWAAYENGSKIVEFIPAMRNSDNVLGFYETVNGVFFTNAGDGAFTGGAF